MIYWEVITFYYVPAIQNGGRALSFTPVRPCILVRLITPKHHENTPI